MTFFKIMPLVAVLWLPASSSAGVELIDADQWNTIGGYSLGSSAQALFAKFGLPREFPLYAAPIRTDRSVTPPPSANAQKNAKCPSGWSAEIVESVNSFDGALQCHLDRQKFEISFAASFFAKNCSYVLPETTVVYFPQQQTSISKVTVSFLPALASSYANTGSPANNIAVDISIHKVLAGLGPSEAFDVGMQKIALQIAAELLDRFKVTPEITVAFPDKEAIWAYRIIAHNAAGSAALTVQIGTLGRQIHLEETLRLSSAEKDRIFKEISSRLNRECK